MFDSKVEKNIVEFIKKSQLGVSSSDIAHFLGLNRMTITKYLAIIRQKALVDFKQFGMAKLWYIPVGLNREAFLENAFLEHYSAMDEKKLKSSIKKTSKKIAEGIRDAYRRFHNVEKLEKHYAMDSLCDAMEKIGAKLSMLDRGDEKILLRNTRSIFRDHIKEKPLLRIFEMDIIGYLISDGYGYAKVCFKNSLSKGDPEDMIAVYVKKTKESDKEKGVEYKPN